MEFFYNNFDFLYLFICINLLVSASFVGDLIKQDKINRYRLNYVIIFLILQALLYLLDIFLIYVPVHIKVEFIRVPLILISFSVLFEAYLYSLSKKRIIFYIRLAMYSSILLAIIGLGAIGKLDIFVYFSQIYCLIITFITFASLGKSYSSKSHSKIGVVGLFFSFLYVFIFCLYPLYPLRQILLEEINSFVAIQTYLKLGITLLVCGCIWIQLNQEVNYDNFDNLGGVFSKYLITLIFLASILACWISVDFVSKLAEKEKKLDLEHRTNLILSTIGLSHITNMASSNEFEAQRSRHIIKTRLGSVTASQPDIRFIYLLSKNKQKEIQYDFEMEAANYKIFNPIIQSEITEKTNFNELIKSVFSSGETVIDSPFFDRSGVWTTILTPIKQAQTGNTVAVLGIDINYFSWKISLLYFRLFPLIFTLLLSLFMVFILKEFLQRRKGEKNIALRNKELLSLNLKLKKTKEELEAANNTKSDFLSSMSHELRTPLNAILGFTEILENKLFGELNPKYEEYATLIHKSGEHLLSLINDVLDISKIEAGKMPVSKEKVSLFQFIDECLKIGMAYPGAQERRFITEFPKKDLLINIDEKLLKQVLLNILSNAIKFTPKNGEIKINVKQKGKMIKFITTDNGIGVSKENLNKILEPFSQVESVQSKEYKGTGLGLSIVIKLIELQGGEFNISSTLGEGTTIEVDIPIQ